MTAFTRYWLKPRGQRIEEAIAWMLVALSIGIAGTMTWVFVHFAHKYW